MIDTLPNTFILGAAKAGTSTLAALLRQHPEVFFSFDKEPMFFSHDAYFERGIQWYTQTYFKDSLNFPIRVEASPHYLYWADKTAQRIHNSFLNQNLRFIVILRNPIERAYSWYWNMRADGREGLSFLDALNAEETRLQSHAKALRTDGSMTYGYCKGGQYTAQLQRYFEFFSKQQFHIMLLDDLQQTPETAIQDLLRFLKIDPKISIRIQTQNPSSAPQNQILHRLVRNPSWAKNLVKTLTPLRFRHMLKTHLVSQNLKAFNYPAMDAEAKQFLQEKFEPEINALSALLNRDLSDWMD